MISCQYTRGTTPGKYSSQPHGITTYTENGIVHAHDYEPKEGNAKPKHFGPRLVPSFPGSVYGIIRAMAAVFFAPRTLGTKFGLFDAHRVSVMLLGRVSLLFPTRSKT